MTLYLWLFFGQLVNFIIAVVNIRAAARGKMAFTMGSDFLFCTVNYLLIQQIPHGDLWGMLCYSAGGAIGSGCAILMTRKWDRSSD